MPIKWIGFVVFVWAILLLLGATFDEQTSAGGTWGPEHQSTLDYLSDVKRVVYADNETGSLAWLTPNPAYFNAFFEMVTWKFSFLKCPPTNTGCPYEYFRLIVLVPFSITAIFGIIYIFFQLVWGALGRFA